MRDLTGFKFGKLTVLGLSSIKRIPKHPKYYWRVKCDCGNEKIIRGDSLGKKTRSCGCLQQESAQKQRVHARGETKTKEYRTWVSIRQRCNNPKMAKYDCYGGRGIKIIERWNNYENFLADMGRCPPGLEIDRIDNNGDYSPENCRWTSRWVQCRNMRTNIFVEFEGRKMCIKDWARELGISHQAIHDRLNRGLETPQVLSQIKVI